MGFLTHIAKQVFSPAFTNRCFFSKLAMVTKLLNHMQRQDRI